MSIEKRVALVANALGVIIGVSMLFRAPNFWTVAVALAFIYGGAMIWVVTLSSFGIRSGREKLVVVGAVIGGVAALIVCATGVVYVVLVKEQRSLSAAVAYISLGGFNLYHLARLVPWLRTL